MKRLLTFAFLTVVLTGCGSTAPNVTVTTLYSPPVFGSQVGELKRVVDHDNGVILYYLVEANGDRLLYSAKTDATK